MENRHGRAPPARYGAVTTPTMRKHRPATKPPHHCHVSKKRRLISKSETLTLAPDPTHNTPSTDQFRPTHSRTHQKHKKHRQIKSVSTYGDRQWVFSSRDFSKYEDKVIFVSYNILGVENASKHPDLYHNVPSKCLDWEHRKKLLYKEIKRYNPSIMCFQEVDHFKDLDDLLQKVGFEGVYLARTGEACDGCAIFWKNELFTLSHKENIEFQRFALRNNVAQLCVLKMIQSPSNSTSDSETVQAMPSRSLVVGNIHVLFHPKRGDVKLGQMRVFLEKAYKLSMEWGDIPVVIAGDFNSMPQSALYQFLASSELDVRLHDRRNISGNTCPLKYQAFPSRNNNAASFWRSVSRPLLYRWSDEELRLATGSEGVPHLRHNLKLHSAYLGIPFLAQGSCRTRDSNGEPLATSYHSKFMGTVDYIWHTKELVPVKVLDTLPMSILRQTGGLPSETWGSDHLALVCELAFVDDDDDDDEGNGT